MKTIAITGGIGAGKSVVSHILRCMGFPVYDCDSEARTLMDTSAEIRMRIAHEISPEAIRSDGTIDRPTLSRIVFADNNKLLTLNSIVHSEVKTHLRRQIAVSPAPLFFIETAILYESGIDRIAETIWEIQAPEHIRISRAMLRSGLSEEQVRARINAQTATSRPSHRIIFNSDSDPLLPQILHELSQLRHT